MKYLPSINPLNNTKNLKIIIDPKIKEKLYNDIKKLKLTIPILEFLKICENIEIDLNEVSDIDKINLNKFGNKIWNFYDYNPKLEMDDLKTLVFLAKKKELKKSYLFSNGDIFYKNDKIALRKMMKNHDGNINYYKYINTILNYKIIQNKFIEYPLYSNISLKDLNKEFFLLLKDDIIQYWDKYQVWTNNINFETININNNEIKFIDPDMFYWKKTTKEINNINSITDFIKKYKYYKLRSKNVLYYLNDYDFDFLKQNIIYLYFSYVILENISSIF